MEIKQTPPNQQHLHIPNKRGSILRSLSFGELKKDVASPILDLNINLEVPSSISSEKETQTFEEKGPEEKSQIGLRKRKTMAIPKRFIDIVPSEILETLSAKEVRRQEIIFEIMNTERHYVNDLKLLIEVCFIFIHYFYLLFELENLLCCLFSIELFKFFKRERDSQ